MGTLLIPLIWGILLAGCQNASASLGSALSYTQDSISWRNKIRTDGCETYEDRTNECGVVSDTPALGTPKIYRYLCQQDDHQCHFHIFYTFEGCEEPIGRFEHLVKQVFDNCKNDPTCPFDEPMHALSFFSKAGRHGVDYTYSTLPVDSKWEGSLTFDTYDVYADLQREAPIDYTYKSAEMKTFLDSVGRRFESLNVNSNSTELASQFSISHDYADWYGSGGQFAFEISTSMVRRSESNHLPSDCTAEGAYREVFEQLVENNPAHIRARYFAQKLSELCAKKD